MRGKRGWLRILEATIAILIVAGTMLAVYTDQGIREETTVSDYSHSIQSEILSDIAIDTTLRRAVLEVEYDISSDLGNGTNDPIYSPKKVRIFFWEGGFPADYCRDECSIEQSGLICSEDSTKVLEKNVATSTTMVA